MHIPVLTFLPLVVVFAYGGGATLYISAYASDRMGDFVRHMVYRGACLFHVLMMTWVTLFIVLVVRCVVSMHVVRGLSSTFLFLSFISFLSCGLSLSVVDMLCVCNYKHCEVSSETR